MSKHMPNGWVFPAVKHYLRVYRRLWLLNATGLMMYRGNFFNSVFVSLFWAVFSVISITLLTSRNPVVFGWSRDDLLVLTGLYSVIVGLFHVFFTRNLEQLSRSVHRGQFDMYLTKPMDAQFLVSCSIVNYSAIPRVVCAMGYVVYLASVLRLSVQPGVMLLLVFFCLMGLVALYAVWFGVLSISVWQSHLFNLSDLMIHMTDAIKYPTDMYGEFRYYITLFLFPLSLAVTLPAELLLGRAEPLRMLMLSIFTAGMFVLSRAGWKYMLRFYTSANG